MRYIGSNNLGCKKKLPNWNVSKKKRRKKSSMPKKKQKR